jgi:uncharacterized protein
VEDFLIAMPAADRSTLPPPALSAELAAKRDRLLATIGGYGRCVVAFSGGIDSTVVAMAARLALGERALAVTGVSPSLAGGELDEARRLASWIGIRHEVMATDEFENPAYLSNAPDRCYHCKTELYTRLEGLAERFPSAVIVNGANLDDRGDYRPGMVAAGEHRVKSPLLECGLTKVEVRALAASWGLPTWDKPASPCLSSRIAYGEEVTPARVEMIDRAERFLRQRGLRELRVRYHRGEHARIEAPADALAALCRDPLRSEVVEHFNAIGFKYVSLDLEGFRSGSMNAVLPVESLRWVEGSRP